MRTILLLLFVMFMFTAAVGCRKAETYGTIAGDARVVKTADILKSPKELDGKQVKIEGQIVTECPSGCWFELEDDGGIIYVDIEPSGLAIPQRVGKTVTVSGKVVSEGNRTIIVGDGVGFQ